MTTKTLNEKRKVMAAALRELAKNSFKRYGTNEYYNNVLRVSFIEVAASLPDEAFNELVDKINWFDAQFVG